jgi:hypothetical protein
MHVFWSLQSLDRSIPSLISEDEAQGEVTVKSARNDEGLQGELGDLAERRCIFLLGRENHYTQQKPLSLNSKTYRDY